MRLTILAVALLTAGPACAAPSAWSRLPDAKAMAAAYPAALSALGISGKATLRCQVAADGRLQGCALIDEQPARLGFGVAAMTLSPLFVMRNPPADGQVNVPIRFQPAADGLLVKGIGYQPPKSSPEQQALARQVVAHAVPGDWLAARLAAFVGQDLPATAAVGDDLVVLEAARTAVKAAAQDDLPWLLEVTAVELAARLSTARLNAALATPPPADPGKFLNASFKGAPPQWALAQALKVQADARAKFCASQGC